MAVTKPYYHNIDLNGNTLAQAVLSGTPTTGGMIGYDSTAKRILLHDGTSSVAIPKSGDIVDGDVKDSAAIGWSKVSKTGSSLADLDTKDASALTSGTLSLDRLSGITTTQLSATAGITSDQLAGSITDDKLNSGVTSTGESTKLAKFDGAGRLRLGAAPSDTLDAASKGWVETQVSTAVAGIDWKDRVECASSTNVTLDAPGATIGGFDLSTLAGTNHRVLLHNQTDASANGIYIWTGAADMMTRATDMDEAAEFSKMTFVGVKYGIDAGKFFYISATGADPVVVGGSSITWTQFQAGAELDGDNTSIEKSGSSFSIKALGVTAAKLNSDVVGNGLTGGNGSAIALPTVGTSGTYNKVMTDAYGRVSSASAETTLSGLGITDPGRMWYTNTYTANGTDWTVTHNLATEAVAVAVRFTDGAKEFFTDALVIDGTSNGTDALDSQTNKIGLHSNSTISRDFRVMVQA